jgi:hypothetical protein
LNALWLPALLAALGIHLIVADSRTSFGIVAGVVIFLLSLARCLSLLLGSVSVNRDGDILHLSRGFRPLERRASYSWIAFAEAYEKFEDGGEALDQAYIVLKGKQQIAFGEDLTEMRRAFLLEVLRRELAARKTS